MTLLGRDFPVFGGLCTLYCELFTVKVSYKTSAHGHGHGRLFAEGGLSLQSLPRKVRNAIALPFYEDVDFVNCHPEILRQICLSKQIHTPFLDDYCFRRDEILSLVCPPSSSSTDYRALAKKIVLAVLYGKTAESAFSEVPSSDWLRSFDTEMTTVRKTLIGGHDSMYRDLASSSKQRKAKATGEMQSKIYNVEGSAMSMLLCDRENQALQALCEYIESPSIGRRVGVLVFDGCMVERPSPIFPDANSIAPPPPSLSDEVLAAASDHISLRTGLRLRLAVKDMWEDRFIIPPVLYSSSSCSSPPLSSSHGVRRSGSHGNIKSSPLPPCSIVSTPSSSSLSVAIKTPSTMMQSPLTPAPSSIIDSPTDLSALFSEERLAASDAYAGKIFLEDLRGLVVSSNGVVYARVGICWTTQKEMVKSLLLRRCLENPILRVSLSDEDKITGTSEDVPYAKRIIEATMSFLPDNPTFPEMMWRSNIGVLCFRNGLYDFRRQAFFTYDERADVFPVLYIPHDFPGNRPDDSLLSEVRERLLLSTLADPEVVRTYLELMARAAAGEYTDKQWALMLGERNSGKGLLQEMNGLAFGPYVNTVNANAFLLQQSASGDAAKSLSWALDCEYKRQTYTNEVKCEEGSKNIKLDGNSLKAFQAGGDPMSARKNYENERTFRIATKLIFNGNAVPKVTPNDALSTALIFNFPYKFVARSEVGKQPFYRPRDDSLKGAFCLRPEVISAFTWLVIDAYTDGPVVPCEKVSQSTQSFLKDVGVDEMAGYFVFTGSREDFVTLSALKPFCIAKGLSYTGAKMRINRMNVKEDKICIKGVVHGRGFYGVRMINGDDDDEDDDGLDSGARPSS